MSLNVEEAIFNLHQDCPYYTTVDRIVIFPKFLKGSLVTPLDIDYLYFGGEKYYKK
jgi:hypothetical protein